MTRRFAILALVTTATSLVAAPRRENLGPAITPANVNQLHPAGQVTREVMDLAWGPKPGELAVLAWEGAIDVLDDTSLKPVRTLAEKKRLLHFTFSRDRDRVAWAENGKTAHVEDLRTGKFIALDVGQDQPSLTFTPDGKFLATGGYGKEAKLWDIANGKVVRTFDTDTDGGLTVAFSPDGKYLALGNRNSDARVFETATGKLLHVLPKRMSQELKFSPSGAVLAVAYVDGAVSLWDPASGKLLHSAATGAQEVYTLDWSPKGDLLATAGREGKIGLWNPNGLKRLKELDAAQWVIRVRFSPDGDKLFAAGGTGVAGSPDRHLWIWSLPAGARK
jgi:WD40 repeat protein